MLPRFGKEPDPLIPVRSRRDSVAVMDTSAAPAPLSLGTAKALFSTAWRPAAQMLPVTAARRLEKIKSLENHRKTNDYI